jgi:hypothetical protein
MPKLNIAAEMIDYQDRSFGAKIAYAFTQAIEILNESPNITPKSLLKELKEKSSISLDDYLAKVIKERTNISVRVKLYSGIPGAIMVFPFSRNNVLLKEKMRDGYYLRDERKILLESIGAKGSVDLKEGKVSGIFEKYVHTLYLDLNVLFKVYHLTADEATAIVMHEVGHAFTYYEYSNRLSTTNQLLAELSNTMHTGELKEDKRVYIFKEIAKNLQLSDKEVSELYNSTDRLILGSNVFKLYIKEIKKLRQMTKYDETNSEALADNFAVRQGYAKELVTGLDKFYTYSPYKSDLAGYLVLTTEFIIDFLIIPARITSVILAAPVFGSVIFLIYLGYLFFEGDLSLKNMTYDTLKQRYERIRQGLVGFLKSDDLDKEQVSDILDSLDEIDDVINDTKDFTTLKEKLMRVISPFSRSIAKDMDRQQLLEEMGNNDLFVESARIRSHL